MNFVGIFLLMGFGGHQGEQGYSLTHVDKQLLFPSSAIAPRSAWSELVLVPDNPGQRASGQTSHPE